MNGIICRKTNFKKANELWGINKKYENGFNNNYYVCITAYFNGQPIAYIVKTIDEKLPKNDKFLSYTYVDKKFRGMGIAKVLTNKMLKYGNFVLQISPLNLISLSTHIKMGFKIINLDITHSKRGFVDISKNNSFYKIKKNFQIPIKEIDFVNNVFQNYKIDNICFCNAKKKLGKINTHYKYYVGMYNLKHTV